MTNKSTRKIRRWIPILGIATIMTVGMLFASLVGWFGPSLQFGVEHRYFVCSGTYWDRDQNSAAVNSASLRLELYHFPVTLWGNADGTAWFTFQGFQVLFLDVQKLGNLVHMGKFDARERATLDIISGNLQVHRYELNYDLECHKVSVS